MNIKAKLSSCCMTAVVLAFTASGSWAADTECVTLGSGANTAIIAVASNFYGPAQALVTAFQGTVGSNTTITICQNSTAHLLDEINNGTGLPPSVFPTDPGFPRYNMFFAANEAAPNSLESTTGNTSFLYAKGIPVFFGLRATVGNASNLVTSASGFGFPITAACTNAGLSSYTINTANAQKVALAGTGAPYGQKSYTIINAITSDEGGGATNLPSTIPSWVYSTLFDNIDVTYDNVITPGATGIKSGFVGKSQICTQLGTISYVQFTGDDCLLLQKAILLKTLAGSNNIAAAALNTYIQGQISGGGWNSIFLPSQCYSAI